MAAGPSQIAVDTPKRNVCLPCRKKRMRCSGDKPCLQCQRARKPQPCVFDDNPTHLTAALTKRVQELEEQISMLEKIPVRPVAKPQKEATTSNLRSLYHDGVAFVDGSRTHAWLSEPPPDWINGEPPDSLRRQILGALRQYPDGVHAQHELPRVTAASTLPPSHPDALHPCLLNAMCLMGCHFGYEKYGLYQGLFLSRVREEMVESLAMADRLFHFILASLTLTRWYISKGRLIEAQHQGSALVQFASSCQLDEITSPWVEDAPVSILGSPRDTIELGERISTFWSVFVLDKLVALTTGFPTTLIDDKITTMWPLPLSTFEDGRAVRVPYGSVSTMFAPNDLSLSVTHDDDFSLKVKSIALLDRSARLVARYTAAAAAAPSDRDTLQNACQWEVKRLDAGITLFLSTLTPRIDMARSQGRMTLTSLYTITTVHGARMELYQTISGSSPALHERTISVAITIADIARECENIGVEPLGSGIGLTWTAACDVLIKGMQTYHQGSSGTSARISPTQIRPRIDCLLSVLAKTANLNALYDAPLQRLQETVSKLGRG